MHTHYDNLKVTRGAPAEVIRAAYKALSQRYHPDKNPSPDAQRIHFDSDVMIEMAQACGGLLTGPPDIDLWDGPSAHDLA